MAKIPGQRRGGSFGGGGLGCPLSVVLPAVAVGLVLLAACQLT